MSFQFDDTTGDSTIRVNTPEARPSIGHFRFNVAVYNPARAEWCQSAVQRMETRERLCLPIISIPPATIDLTRFRG
jgi:hypothetical protein